MALRRTRSFFCPGVIALSEIDRSAATRCGLLVADLSSSIHTSYFQPNASFSNERAEMVYTTNFCYQRPTSNRIAARLLSTSGSVSVASNAPTPSMPFCPIPRARTDHQKTNLVRMLFAASHCAAGWPTTRSVAVCAETRAGKPLFPGLGWRHSPPRSSAGNHCSGSAGPSNRTIYKTGLFPS